MTINQQGGGVSEILLARFQSPTSTGAGGPVRTSSGKLTTSRCCTNLVFSLRAAGSPSNETLVVGWRGDVHIHIYIPEHTQRHAKPYDAVLYCCKYILTLCVAKIICS